MSTWKGARVRRRFRRLTHSLNLAINVSTKHCQCSLLTWTNGFGLIGLGFFSFLLARETEISLECIVWIIFLGNWTA